MNEVLGVGVGVWEFIKVNKIAMQNFLIPKDSLTKLVDKSVLDKIRQVNLLITVCYIL